MMGFVLDVKPVSFISCEMFLNGYKDKFNIVYLFDSNPLYETFQLVVKA